MVNGRRIILAVICGLIVTSVAHADMVSVSLKDIERKQSLFVYNQDQIPDSDLTNSYLLTHVADLDSWPAGLLSQTNTDIEQTSHIQQLQSFTNGPGSLNLCLSALIGLGLCSSAHFVKKLSFSFFVPEWYHSGGPFQIGHSYAVSPESLCPIAVYCFIQPICKMVEDSLLYRLGTVASLWRKSQFTPAVTASRGPPLIS
ncbi:MAG: hypothetical protein JW837_11920 [Sedimentisphaerales bacterium]|nr:hypothetical protein [Sedimentisphaerales bacterium]